MRSLFFTDLKNETMILEKLDELVDCWDMERDALNWPGGNSVIAHPPCRAWGQLSHMENPRPGEKGTCFFCYRNDKEVWRSFGTSQGFQVMA